MIEIDGDNSVNFKKSRIKTLDKLYSICITCRNNISTVRESLESILNQIDDIFEVIVVDGKSVD